MLWKLEIIRAWRLGLRVRGVCFCENISLGFSEVLSVDAHPAADRDLQKS